MSSLKYRYIPREGDPDALGYIPPRTNAYGAMLQLGRVTNCDDPAATQVFYSDKDFEVVEDSDIHHTVRSHKSFKRIDGIIRTTYISEVGDEWDDAAIFEHATGNGIPAKAAAHFYRGMKR
jgi:hypothetical protein